MYAYEADGYYDPDYSLLFFNPQKDMGDGKWMQALSLYFENSHRFSDESLSDRCLVMGVSLGDVWCKQTLALRYINDPQYIDRYDHGIEIYSGTLGTSGAAPFFIERLTEDVRFGNPHAPGFNEWAHEVLSPFYSVREKSNHELWALGILEARVRHPIKQAKAARHFLAAFKQEEDTIGLSHNIGCRAVFGIGIEQNLMAGLELLTRCGHAECGFRKTVYPLTEMFRGDKGAQIACQEIAQLIAGLFHSDITSKRAKTSFLSNPLVIQNRTITLHLLKIMDGFSIGEEWPQQDFWQSLYEDLCLTEAGLPLEDIERSTLLMGPRYNPTAPNGFPVAYLHEGPSRKRKPPQKPDNGFVPAAGTIALDSLTGWQDGTVSYDCSTDRTKPAYLLEEDFKVCAALVFGGQHPINPGLSVEKDSIPTHQNIEFFLQRKVWDPKWLGHTDFGRTLYYTDILAGEVCWSSKWLYMPEVTKKGRVYTQQYTNSRVSSFFNELSRMDATYQDPTMQTRIMLRPEVMDFTLARINDQRLGQGIKLEPSVTRMRIDGAYKREKVDGSEDREVALNDTRYLQGKRCQYMTDHYNELCRAFPVFERARQIMILYHAFLRLSQAWSPNADLKARCAQDLRYFRSLPEIPQQDLIIRRCIVKG